MVFLVHFFKSSAGIFAVRRALFLSMPASVSALSLPAIPQCAGTHMSANRCETVSKATWIPCIKGCLFLGFSVAVMALCESDTTSTAPSLGAVTA